MSLQGCSMSGGGAEPMCKCKCNIQYLINFQFEDA
ncbi:hypothetical protein T02_3457 [Trichinella nativa]|uniref:Uncharacterized protein n=1 Tax=Trichinella nativa TaxID=6335 RepID=A0A0V1KLQ8_9BILA|nr:hypothetical protein T02_3457 [Trichinella nativa]